MRRVVSWIIASIYLSIGISVNGIAAEKNSDVPQTLLIGVGRQLNHETAQRIVSALQNVRKTLVLERTRGLADVEVYEKSAQAVVFVMATKDSFGSGAIIDDKGHIVTNWHVVNNQPKVFVVLKPRDSTELRKELVYQAVVEKIDEVADLALLRIVAQPPSLQYLQLGDAKKLAVGQDVHAIGHPVGETWTYTKGIISQLRENYEWSAVMGEPTGPKLFRRKPPSTQATPGDLCLITTQD